MKFFTDVKETNLTFMWNHRKRTKQNRIAKVTFNKKNKAGDFILQNFKRHYKTFIIQTAWYCHKY
jgi:hypothetical protein